MGKKIDIVPNERHGNFVILKEVERAKDNRRQVLCLCDCGKEFVTKLKYVCNGETKSCGCLKHKVFDKVNYKHGYAHRFSKERLYNIWCLMKKRCFNPQNPSFKYYGAKGISVCEEWKDDYVSFRTWAYANGYNDLLSIDRIDVNGNYCPSNCRWATDLEQANNMTTNIKIKYKDETHTLAEWGRILGINPKTVQQRFREGRSLEQVFCVEDLNKHKSND